MALKDKSEMSPSILREAVISVERGYDDRWPARGKTGSRGGDYRPLEDVSREGFPMKYRKYPSASG